MTIKTKITLSYVLLAIGGIVVLSILASAQINAYLDERTVTSLRQQTAALGSMFGSGRLTVNPDGSTDEELLHLARTLGLRLTVIRSDGVVVFDSDVIRDSLPRLENHATRPEVLAARNGIIGVERRHSVSLGEDLLYAATEISGPNLGTLDSGFVRTAMRLNEITAIDTRIQVIIWSVGAFVVALTVLLSLEVSKRLAKPILDMAGTAVRIRDGDLQQRIPIRSKDELATLGYAINDLAGKLSNDIEQLRRLERVRTEFLGNVSHELRTPIFSIQGFIETLLDGALDDPAVNREFLEKAHKHAGRLNTLLNDLIEISRIESGDMKMSFRYFNVRQLIVGAVDEMQEYARKKSLTLKPVLELSDEVTAFGDRERLQQALTNLIDNAIKYTDAGGTIVCGARADTSSVEIWVQDTGSGIPAEHLPRIFERFYRVDKDRSREVGGTGLGLAIVKHIIEAHGSAVNVQSSPGKGSTFRFSLKQ